MGFISLFYLYWGLLHIYIHICIYILYISLSQYISYRHPHVQLQRPQVQKRFGFPENSVELFAERVEILGFRIRGLLSEVPRLDIIHFWGLAYHWLYYIMFHFLK